MLQTYKEENCTEKEIHHTRQQNSETLHSWNHWLADLLNTKQELEVQSVAVILPESSSWHPAVYWKFECQQGATKTILGRNRVCVRYCSLWKNTCAEQLGERLILAPTNSKTNLCAWVAELWKYLHRCALSYQFSPLNIISNELKILCILDMEMGGVWPISQIPTSHCSYCSDANYLTSF